MSIFWRTVFLLGAIALAAIMFLIVRSNLRTGALLTAVRSSDAAAARRVLERDASLITTPVMPQGSRSTSGRSRWLGRTLMHELVTDPHGGSIDMADTLLAFGADLKMRLNGDSLLHLAADSGDLPMMTWLLDNGVDVNARNGCEHPDEAICTSGTYLDWQPFDRRRASGTVCTGCDHDGQTPLHAAQRSMRAYEGSTLLLARGADVHAVDAGGRTPLHAAAQGAVAGQDSRVLCAHGADAAARDRHGKTPADLAREAERKTSADRPIASGQGELTGWLEPDGGCARLAARARPGAPVPADEVDAAWRAYVCTRDARYCEQ